MEPITVRVHARDPISEAGVASELRARPEVRVVKTNDSEQVRVVVIVTDSVDDDALTLLRIVQRTGVSRAVLVAGHLDDGDLVNAVETGVVGLVRRSEATPDRLVSVIAAAASGEGSVPPDLLGRLLDQVGKLQRHVHVPLGIMFTGLAPREVEVLRLLPVGGLSRCSFDHATSHGSIGHRSRARAILMPRLL